MDNRPQTITLSTLKTRGWTDATIKRWLGNCDIEAVNPHYRSGPPMKLFFLDRVIEKEQTEEFQQWLEKSKVGRAKISKASKERADRARKELWSYIDNLHIQLPKIEPEKLTLKACLSYNELWAERERYDRIAKPTDDKEFLNRITVNYLRHCCSCYEEELYELFGKIGKDEAYFKLKARILDAIATKYPYLKGECQKQKSSI